MSDFKIVSKKAKVDQCYGLDAFYITKEMEAGSENGEDNT